MPISRFRARAAAALQTPPAGKSSGQAALLRDPVLLRRTARDAARALEGLTSAGPIHNAFLRGAHGRRKAGSGDSFWQFRPYSQGDSAAMIDWRRSARANSYYVRQYEWEAARDIWLICDLGPHMHYASHQSLRTKAQEAAVLTVAIAHLLAQGGERVALLGLSPRAAAGKFGTDLLANTLISNAQREQRDVADLTPPPPGTHTIWVSDFLTPLDRLQRRLRAVARGGTRLHMVQVIDPSESAFPFEGRIRFEGPSRADGHLIERAQDVKSAYARRFAAHNDAARDLAREAGGIMLRHRTDKPIGPSLVALSAGLLND